MYFIHYVSEWSIDFLMYIFSPAAKQQAASLVLLCCGMDEGVSEGTVMWGDHAGDECMNATGGVDACATGVTGSNGSVRE
jgi:hypothetical protein